MKDVLGCNFRTQILDCFTFLDTTKIKRKQKVGLSFNEVNQKLHELKKLTFVPLKYSLDHCLLRSCLQPFEG